MNNKSATATLRLPNQSQREWSAFIEFQLYFHGKVRRASIEYRVGTASAAIRDLRPCRSLAQDDLRYEVGAKRYVMEAVFVPLFEISAERAWPRLRCGFVEGFTHVATKQAASIDASPSYRLDPVSHHF